MSYPNPQNPYGQQPQQGYGFPQQPPQPHPGYGYPQQAAGPYGGYPQGPMGGPPVPHMLPSPLKAARVILFVMAGLDLLVTIGFVVGLGYVSKASKSASGLDSDTLTSFAVGKGFLIAGIVLTLVWAAIAVALGLVIAKGGPGVRVGMIVYSAITCFGSMALFPWGLLFLVLAILVITFASKQESSAWFNRPAL
ncbi:hypothetical protein ACFV3R_07815 [Streptomyces sp. NPDC059740]|uniref:hypothetical protein n=1 Tax=Streptomyces sp. NPDC059740 TaxID=3346926 RepID=UPI0036668D4D